MSERLRVVVCEGYQDRAFWAGWLEGPLGWTSREGEKNPQDALGTVKGGGVFGYRRDGLHLRLVPAMGRSEIVPKARVLAQKASAIAALDVLVACIDSDAADPDDRAPRGQHLAQTLRDGSPSGLVVRAVEWRCDDPACAGVPAQQTLERLVCAAIAEVHPQRASDVEAWLAAGPHDKAHKQRAWSFYARWYAAHGPDHFWRAVWADPSVAAALEKRLRASGAWAVAEALAV